MKFSWGKGLLVAAVMIVSAPASAGVVVQIDKSSQRMAVSIDGAARYNWPVSTGRRGYGTPSGVFRPQAMVRRHFSRKYYNSPMPHSIFLPLRRCHSRHQRTLAARRPRLAWLRPSPPVARRGAVRAGPAQRPAKHAHHDQLERGRPSLLVTPLQLSFPVLVIRAPARPAG